MILPLKCDSIFEKKKTNNTNAQSTNENKMILFHLQLYQDLKLHY